MNKLHKWTFLVMGVFFPTLIGASTPPQVINKLCPANEFFSQIQPGPNNIQCTQPTYSGIASTPSFIRSIQYIAGNVSLVGDSANPGSSKYYGTDSSGTRGFYSFPTGVLSIGTIDSVTPSSNGAALSGSALIMQSASDSNPGLVNTTTQTFTGDKTFAGNVSVTADIDANNLSGTNTGDVTIGTSNGLSIVSQSLSLALSSTSTTGALSSTDWNTFNNKQVAGNYMTALTGDVVATGPGSASSTIQAGVVTNSKLADMSSHSVKANISGSSATPSDQALGTVTEDTSSVLTLTGWAFATVGSPTIQVLESGPAQSGYLSSTDWNTFNNKQAAGSYITALTGDVAASGPGSAAATIQSGVITNSMVNAAAAIAGTKISPSFGSQNISTTGTSTTASFIPTSSSVPTNGLYLPAANTSGISSNSTSIVRFSYSSGAQIRLDTTGTDAGLIYQGVDAGTLIISGGNAATSGANIRFYGGSHASAANQFEIRQGSTVAFSIATSTGLIAIGASGSTQTNVLNGSLQITQGLVLTGTSLSSARILDTGTGSGNLSSTTQIGFNSRFTSTSGATASVEGVRANATTAATSFTAPYLAQFYANNSAKGSGSTITRHIMFLGDTPTQGTNNAFLTDATTGWTSNWFILQSSGTRPSRFNASVIIGAAALSTSATDGFLYVPSSAGTPTGTPTSQTGTIPMEVDTTNGKVYFYYGGSWHFATLT